ncbi:unnamed protein product [Arctogadus glacialis]
MTAGGKTPAQKSIKEKRCRGAWVFVKSQGDEREKGVSALTPQRNGEALPIRILHMYVDPRHRNQLSGPKQELIFING